MGLTLTAGSMIVLRKAHSLCETEVAPRFIPSLMIFYHQGLFVAVYSLNRRAAGKGRRAADAGFMEQKVRTF